MRRMRLPIVLLVVAGLAAPAAASAAAPSGQAAVNAAVTRLVLDTRHLSRKSISKHNRTALLHALRKAKSQAKRNPCKAIATLARYRRGLNKIHQRKLKGRTPGAGGPRGKLDADALQLDVALLALPKSKRCGGGKPSTVGFATPQRLASDTNQLRLRLTLPAPTFASHQVGGTDYEQMFMQGMGETGDVGKPGLPEMTRYFGVPAGANASLTVNGTTGYDLNGVNLYPHQHSPVDVAPGEPAASTFANPPFSIDSKAYGSNAGFPPSAADGSALGMFRNLHVGGADLAGGVYHPHSHRLHVFTTVDVTIKFGGFNAGNFGSSSDVMNPWDGYFVRNYAAFVDNWDTIVAHLGPIHFHPWCGEDMLVVTSAALQPAATTFANARQAAGFDPRVVVVGSGAGEIGSTPAQIQAYIQHELTSTCLKRPQFVVLIGNTDNVPTFEVPCSPSPAPGDTCNIASDLPYSLDGLSSDLFADTELGRLPAPDLATANTVVNKILNYESTSPAPPGDDFFHHATVTSYFQPSGTPGDTQDTRGFTKTSEAIQNAIAFNGYNVDRLYTTDSASVNPQTYYDGTPIPSNLRRPTFGWNATSADFLGAYNAGRFLILHRDHGWPDGWANPQLWSGDIPSLTNGSKLPVVFGINCASATFDNPADPSFIERQLQDPSGGAVAGFGDTRNSPSFPNNHMALGMFDALFPNLEPTFGSPAPTRRLGDVLLSGKAFMASQEGLDFQGSGDTYVEHYLYHLLGDPSMQMWAAAPFHWNRATVNVQYEARAPVGPGDPVFQVLVNLPTGLGDPPPQGSIVTLYHDGDAIGRGTVLGNSITIVPDTRTDAQGLTVSLEQDGTLPDHQGVQGTPPAQTSMSITCPSGGTLGQSVTVSGQLTGAPGGSTVHVTWTSPNVQSQPITDDVKTDATGAWSDQLAPKDIGHWTVSAKYDGDATHAGSSNSCGFDVARSTSAG